MLVIELTSCTTQRVREAREVLKPICAWFTDGRQTLDYMYSEALLGML